MIATALKYWREIGMAALAFACSILWGLWQHESNLRTKDKLAQEKAVREAQERAEALSNELVIEQAKAMARTEKVVIEYRDRIRSAPDDVERNRLGTLGVRDILRPGQPEAK